MIAGVAAFATWLGVSLIVVADGRRGLALGLAIASVALAVVVWQPAGPIASAALLVGGAAAAAQRLRSGPPGWNVMPAGSTPRLVMCVATGLVALWIAASVMTGGGAPLRFAVLTGIGLAGARVLGTDDVAAVTTALAALVLALAAAASMNDAGLTLWPYVAAGVVAAGAAWLPRRKVEPR